MKKALFYKKLKGNIVQCELCPKCCVIKDRDRGDCGVRENENGKLYSLVYGKLCAVAVENIEKKPLYHFLPGSMAYSIGTAGCQMHCLFCQNYSISQAKPEDVESVDSSPEDVVNRTIENNCKSIAYTFTEPIVATEFVLDTAKLAKKNGIKNVMISNGYINEKPLQELCEYIDAANIDFKAFNDDFYKKYTGASLKPVLNSLKILKENKVHLELTNLIIPRLNDNKFEIDKMCKWIKTNLGRDTVIHFSRFFPHYKMNIYPTSEKILNTAKQVAKRYLDYVYVGNIHIKDGANTFCPKCEKLLIKRLGLEVIENNLVKGKCTCGKKIKGVW